MNRQEQAKWAEDCLGYTSVTGAPELSEHEKKCLADHIRQVEFEIVCMKEHRNSLKNQIRQLSEELDRVILSIDTKEEALGIIRAGIGGLTTNEQE